MKGRLKDLTFGRNSKQLVTLEVDGDLRELFDLLKDDDVDFDIKKFRKKRSKTANAYFHVLVNKIAEAQSLGDDEIKAQLVCEYGVLAKDDDGQNIGFKLPSSVKVSTIYPYVRCFDTRIENGKEFSCYLVYKQTQFMDSKEMYRLIEGAIYVAKDLGIETDTPEELGRLKSLWEQGEKA